MSFQSPFVSCAAARGSRRDPAIGRFLIVLWVLVLSQLATHRAGAQQLGFRQYTQDQGLLNLGLNCVAQDHDGFIYACTEHGLLRYNGMRFANPGAMAGVPAAGVVRGFDTAPNGRSYVTFNDAVYLSDPDTGSGSSLRPQHFASVRSPDGEIEVDGDHRTALLGNDLLVVERHRLSIIRQTAVGPSTIEPFFSAAALASNPALRTLRSISVDQGILWLGCGSDAVCRVAPEGVSVLGPQDGVPRDSWTSFLRDRRGVMWMRSLTRIAHQSPGAARFEDEPVPGGAGRYAGHADWIVLAEDTNGHLMTQGANGLLVRRNGRWISLTRHNGVPIGSTTAIFFDHEGSLWLAVRDQGIFRSQGYGRWENWDTDDGLSDNVVWQVSRQKGGPLWVASEGGVDALIVPGTVLPHLAHLDGTSFAVAATAPSLVWRGTTDGAVERLDAQSTRIDPFALPPLNGIFRSREGRLWFFTEDGLYLQANPNAAQPAPPMRVPGVIGHVRAIAEDTQGSMWLIADRALLRLGPKGDVHVVLNAAHEATYKPRALAVPAPGSVWIGGVVGGIQELHVADDHVTSISFVTTPTIGSETLQFLQRDSRGWIWAGTDRGLDVFNGQAWRHVDEDDGLLSNDLDEGAVFEDDDDSMWFGTGHGLSHLLAPENIFKTSPLRPIITDASVGGLPLPGAAIGSAQAPLVISFSALNFRIERAIRFRYRLEGVDADWVETASREVRYPVLPPGRHLFSVIAVDPYKRDISQPISLLIRVRTPLWRQWPFLLLYGALVLTLLGIAAHLRDRFLLARQRHLETLVAERTHEIELARLAILHQATHDSLTGLANRMAIMEALDATIALASATGAPFAVGLIDLDHFKQINDGYGHLAGDAVLREFGLRLRNALESNERAGRYGGEELLLIVPGDEDATCERILNMRDHVTGRVVITDARAISVTCSVGVAWFQAGDSAEALIDRADKALYSAKNGGRDRIVYRFNS